MLFHTFPGFEIAVWVYSSYIHFLTIVLAVEYSTL